VIEFPGWKLVGQYESGVGSWLLHHGGEACLLEVPEGLKVSDVSELAYSVGVAVKLVAVSHDHWDHLDMDVWRELKGEFPYASFLHPKSLLKYTERVHCLGGERLFLLPAPKHSLTDTVAVFRGIAATGDIELGTLDSVNDEVGYERRRRSMAWLKGFERRNGYRVHTVVSAHLDDVRTGVDWEPLFSCEKALCK
jgi:hypothetical protein